LGPLQYSDSGGSTQEAAESSGRFRSRCCLLKGCERMFRPTHPRCHYCSDACRREAKKWQAWRAAGHWRATDRGKECRRAQSRRYRRLIPLVVLTEAPAPSPEPVVEPLSSSFPEPVVEPLSSSSPEPVVESLSSSSPEPVVESLSSSSPEPVVEPLSSPPAEAKASLPEVREGQLIEQIPENFIVRPCRRPGCYVLFGVPGEWSPRRFCCDLCHKALRRVLDREARYQRRRRAGVRPRCRRSRPPPKPRK
jgi:hypothetical protein